MCLKARGFPAVAVGSPQLAASAVVRCGRLQRTLKDGHADRRGNCRGVNRLEIGTCAVTLAR